MISNLPPVAREMATRLRAIALRQSLKLLLASLAIPASAQSMLPNNYGDYYKQSVAANRPGVGSNSNSYLYDKYFYHQPSVSPYLNLSRRGTQSADQYSSWVRPEQKRRKAASQSLRGYVQDRKLAGNVGHTDYGRATGRGSLSVAKPRNPAPSPYYNQFYRGSKR